MVDDEALFVLLVLTQVSAEEADGDSMANSVGERGASTVSISVNQCHLTSMTKESEIRTGCENSKCSFGWQRWASGMIASITLTRGSSESVQETTLKRPKPEKRTTRRYIPAQYCTVPI
ncbi:hypothetical protein V8C26DRAFT_406431 [Trichoderma gracile]